MSGLKYTLVVRHPESGEPVALLEGTQVPSWAKDLVDPDDLDEVSGESRTKTELEAEIARRNERRDEADLIEPAGKNKADLVAALEADDVK